MTGGINSRYRPMRNHEMMYFFYEQSPKYNRDKYHKRIQKITINQKGGNKSGFGYINEDNFGKTSFETPNPATVVEVKTDLYGEKASDRHERYLECGCGYYEPPNPASVVESNKVFIGKRNHQTEKPQDILEFLLKYWTDEDDVVLDPTMGSGSTGVACKKLKRKFIGFELDPKIFETAKKRIEA